MKDINGIIDHYFKKSEDYQNEFYPPASFEQIKSVEKKLDFNFPEDYKSFLKFTNGFEGFVGENFCKFNNLDEIIEATENCCKEFFPWAIQIGGNGGGEMFILDTRKSNLGYGILPNIGDDSDFISLGESFEGFINHLFQNDFW